MCMALPSRVLRIDGALATVDSGGQPREVSLALMEPGSVAVGDWVLVQLGRFVFERLEPEDARAALALIDQLAADDAAAATRAWG